MKATFQVDYTFENQGFANRGSVNNLHDQSEEVVFFGNVQWVTQTFTVGDFKLLPGKHKDYLVI